VRVTALDIMVVSLPRHEEEEVGVRQARGETPLEYGKVST
jgi:hypothetical protein